MNKLSFKKQWREARTYLNESRNFVYFTIIIFILSGIFGFVASDRLGFLDNILLEIFSKAGELNTLELTLFILQNNLQSAFLGMVFGIVLGIFPIVNAVTNGVVLGYVVEKTVEVAGISSVWLLLPHGIFELPAIFISLGLGVKLGAAIFAKNRQKELKKRFYSSMNTFFMIVVPLLIIAAIIEGLLVLVTG